MTKREKIKELKTFIRQPYVFPGGYEKIMMANDGCVICHTCAEKEFRNILHSTKFEYQDGWEFVCVFVNWEDDTLTCSHCGRLIPSEYGEDTVEKETEVNNKH